MKLLITILSVLVVSPMVSQTIEKSSIDSGGASLSSGDIQLLYTIGETNIQEVQTPSISISEGFINSSFKLRLNAKLFLQGPLINANIANLMNDDLRLNTLIPTTSPYEDDATCEASVFNVTGNNAIVDWVWIELRAASDNAIVVKSRSALLQRDGDVVDTDGISCVEVQAPPNTYHILAKHRNHLGVMSFDNFILREETSTVVDFTDSAFQTFGNNAQVLLTSGNTALWAGDLNNDNKIQFSGANNDVNSLKDFILANASIPLLTFPVNGYFNKDTNLDGLAKFSGSDNDSNLIKDIVLGHPVNVILGLSTFTINSQVPNN